MYSAIMSYADTDTLRLFFMESLGKSRRHQYTDPFIGQNACLNWSISALGLYSNVA